MPSSNPKQSGSKAPANTPGAFHEYMDTAAEVKAPKPSDADTQVGSKSAKRNKGSSGREPQGFSWGMSNPNV
jgi:hypothetical protein